jgi:hypothetical protein
VFTSRPSLWTDLDCEDEDQAHVYLKRSKSLPVNLSLRTEDCSLSYHPFFDIIPHAIGRLRSLSIAATPRDLKDITDHLSRPAPLLKKLSVHGGYYNEPHRSPALTPALFNGDLSSLRKLRLESVRTELPWRNMVNLTSFKLYYSGATTRQLLNFFESAPRLREIDLHSTTATPGAQNGQLVSLAWLERMDITGGGSASHLLDHMLIPVGTRMMVDVDLPSPPINDRPPRFLDNLRNLPNFTAIELWSGLGSYFYMKFSGPNGQVRMNPSDKTSLALEALDQFDTSKTEQLEIGHGKSLSGDSPYRALLPMKHLRTLTLYQFASSHSFVHALHPGTSSSGITVCPKLEKLSIEHPEEALDLKDVIGMAAARASRGAKLKFVRITQGSCMRTDALELKKHALHVECGPEFDGVDGDGDGTSGGD